MRKALVAVVLAVCLTVAACGGDRPVTGLRVMVPNNPGSGYDVTARSAVLAMEQAGLARNVEVFNLPGASGTIGLQRLVNERGNGALLMQMGLGVVGAVHTARSPVDVTDTTPIARLTEDAEAVAVPADSPYRSLDELVTAWRTDPSGVAVAGPAPVGRTTSRRTCSLRPSVLIRARSPTSSSTGAATCSRRSWGTGSRSGCPARPSSATRSGPGSCAC